MTTTRTCRRAAEMELGANASQPLSEEQFSELAEHVETCEVCRRWLEESTRIGGLGMLADDLKAAERVWREMPLNIATPVDRLNELLGVESTSARAGAGGKAGYRVECEIGRGGMGVVYKAWQPSLHRHVALKVLPALLGAVRPDAMERFRREAALAAGLKHSNIIGVYDFGEVGGTLYYAMELVEGRSLRDLIQEMREAGGLEAALTIVASATDKTPTPSTSAVTKLAAAVRGGSSGHAGGAEYFKRVAGWIADVAEALHYAHEQGVLHRDIKPANLLLSRAGRLMICDFGLARSMMVGSPNGVDGHRPLTMTQALIGTSRYMSPESVDATVGPVDRRSDVYALGATLYELLTFKPLFAAEDDREILHRVISTEPMRPRAIVRQVPTELEIICQKALAKRPRERYESAQAFADDLQRWVLGMPILARRPPAMVRALNFVRRRKAMSGLTLAMVLAVSAGGVLGVRAWRASDQAEKSAADFRASQVTLLFNQAVAAAEAGQPERALSASDQGLALDPGNLALLRERGRALHAKERGREAAEVLEKVCAKYPDDLRSHLYLLAVYQWGEAQSSAKLREQAAQVVRLAPGSSDAFLARGVIATDDREAISLFTKSLELQPNRTDALLNRAHRYGNLREHQSQLDDLEKVSARVPDGVGLLLQRGQAYQGLNRPMDAEDVLTKAIMLDTKLVAGYVGRAQVRSVLGKHEESIADATRAIELAPASDIQPCLTRAWSNLQAGQLADAKADFDRVIEIDPRYDDAYVNRAIVLSRLNLWEDALADCDRAIELRRTNLNARNNRIAALVYLNRPAEAIPDVDELIRLEPNSADRYRMRAILTQKIDQLAEAEDALSHAIAIDGRNAGDFGSRAWLRIALGRPEMAIADFTRSIELDGTKTNCFTGRAHAYAMLGQWDLALQDLDEQSGQTGVSADKSAILEYFVLAEAGRTELAARLLKNSIAIASDKFTRVALQLASGSVGEEQLLEVAKGTTEQTRARFYAGMVLMLAGDKPAAIERFEQCVQRNAEAVDLAYVARGRLELMRAGAQGR
ncbi:MAG: protein kinase [Phycisphaeraceae bacterium]|nr:protein kinase [Phycisphaeraceae bacterium]